MKVRRIALRNYRRLEDVTIDFEQSETVFVGPNNSGKTSGTTAFRHFVKRNDFKVYDFSVSQIAKLDGFGQANETGNVSLPTIEMDLWFSIDPDAEFDRVITLVPSISEELDDVGVRMSFAAKDAVKLKAAYLQRFPRKKDGRSEKTLSQFLAVDGNLGKHFELNYFALEDEGGEVKAQPLPPEDGKKALQSLIRVDFVDAQRNIDDRDVARSTRLSAVLTSFYRKNLEQAETNEDANRIIDENNEKLTQHYQLTFEDLFEVIRNLGVPSVADRQLKIVSALNPDVALQGNTELIYVDPKLQHELPEAYNGLGFKNLIYLAIQISHFHLQWIRTEERRPLCQLIFVEEPEVHLHAQVQQTFIANVWEIIKRESVRAKEPDKVPQLAVTTHSSHILETVDFEKVRYFRRCQMADEASGATKTLHASTVVSLRNFTPQGASAPGVVEDETETLAFLKRYLKLTHCDLFFADAAVPIEGSVEKLLMPYMIEKVAKGLQTKYLSVLEVGGAYAHRFASLLKFLAIPYLVVTDIDSVDPASSRSACRADKAGAESTNRSLKFYLNKTTIEDLAALAPESQILAEGECYVAYQRPQIVKGHGAEAPMHGRTFEESFAFANIQHVRDKSIDLGVELPATPDFEQDYELIHKRIRKATFKKTEFALNVAASDVDWKTPPYIEEGLRWLDKRLSDVATGDNGE